MDKLKKLITYLVERFQEPSTIRGIVLVASAMGAQYNQEMQSSIIHVGLLIAGVIAIITPDSILTKKIEPNNGDQKDVQ